MDTSSFLNKLKSMKTKIYPSLTPTLKITTQTKSVKRRIWKRFYLQTKNEDQISIFKGRESTTQHPQKLKEIVSAEWLHQNLSKPNLVILDASLASTATGKQFEQSDVTIPNARPFDLKNNFHDPSSPYPNTVPNPQQFEAECRKLGINQNSEIVVFDNAGVYTSPRVWWLFRVMGHHKIAVLDGGLLLWIQKGFPSEPKQLRSFETGNFKTHYNKDLVISFEQIKQNTTQNKFLVVDARSEGRFNGTDSEPRKQLKSGSIPNSVNIPYQDVLENGKFKSKDDLKQLFETKCNSQKQLVFSCGSGLTACTVMLASTIAYENGLKVFDGSWTEWAERNNLKNLDANESLRWFLNQPQT